MADDPGVMGNLPRSRPGRRSEKRGDGTSARAKPAGSAKAATGGSRAKASGAKASGSARAKSSGTTRAKTSGSAKAKPRSSGRSSQAAKPRDTAPRTAVRDERVEERQGQDPITAALRAGMAVGDAGVKVLSKIVQRLPRP